MPAFGRLHMIAARPAPDMRDAKPGARADDADRAALSQRLLGAGQMQEMFIAGLRHRMAHRAEIIDDDEAVHAQLSRTPANAG